ncbi:DEAD/DEAH box helicase [Thermomonas fusca]|uniref:DEAD/DEAH box helicase n=1 Tax=Thermomonas fusca TaxID=215690 RepID=A0A5R9PIA5_9GAMM|nr:DEAD/DEAH box helicase [Thermomonas fusca]TLX22478.1 DEAD/DEAH box helicase [Thermomonas fusca]
MAAAVQVVLNGRTTAVLTAERVRQLAELEVALIAAGCTPIAGHNPSRLTVPLAQLSVVMPSLEAWAWTMDPETSSAMDKQRQVLEQHRLAKARVGWFDSDLVSAQEALEKIVPPGLLDPHQVVAVAAASDPIVSGLCLFDEQGLGKTLEGIAAFHAMRQRGLVRRALIFAPKNMLTEWERDIQRFFPGQYRVNLVSGTPKQRRAAIQADADLYVANFETAITEEAALRSLLKMRVGGGLLVVDESFHVKNPEAIRTGAIRRLRENARRCLVLCGTPAPNAPGDIVEQFNIADGGITFAGVKVPDDLEQAKEVIAATIEARGVYLRRLKIDVLPDLPGKTFHRTLVPLTPSQQSLYVSMLREYVTDLEHADAESFSKDRISFLARRARLLRICTDPSGVSDGFAEVPAKRQILDSLLVDLIEQKTEKVVLWTSYTRAIDDLMDRYAKYNPVRIDGAVSDIGVRREAITRFQGDDTTKLFIGNPAAAGAGITLHRAKVAIYESLPIQAAAYFQSLDRIHRRGQQHPVDYIILLAAGTLEIGEYERLVNKARRSRELLGDRDPEDLTLDTLLNEAHFGLKVVEVMDGS